MRVGQPAQLVMVVFRRLMIARLPDFDGEQIVRNGATVHHDIGINRFSEVVVGRDNRSMREPQRPLPQPVVIAVDLPAADELLFEMHRQPVRQRALAEILLQQMGFARVEFPECRDHPAQFRLHLGQHAASVKNILRPRSRWFDGRLYPYIRTSISRGPWSGMASASALLNSSAVVTARPWTP